MFGKSRKDTNESIDNLLKNLKAENSALAEAWFNEVVVRIFPNGNKERYYEMTRDGFTLALMGFNNTPEVLKWKLRYIALFNAMEAAINKNMAEGGHVKDDVLRFLGRESQALQESQIPN